MSVYTSRDILNLAARNAFFSAALEQDAGYRRAVVLRDQLRDYVLPPVERPTSPLDDENISLDEFLTAAAQADDAERARDAKIAAHTRLMAAVDNEICGALDVDPDRVLAHLAGEFDALLEDLAGVAAQLGGARDPGEAIERGTADKWRELAALRERWDDIRAAADHIYLRETRQWQASRSIFVDDPLATDMSLSNVDNVFPTWRRPPEYGMDGQVIDRRPWPADPIQQLVWLTTSAAQPRLPTLEQLDQLHADRHATLNPRPKPKPRSDYPRQTIHAVTGG